MRCALFCAFFLWLNSLFAASPALTLTNEQLPSPAPVGATKPEFFAGQPQSLVLAWSPATAGEETTLDSMCFQQATRSWQSARFIDSALTPLHTVDSKTGEIQVHNAGRQAKAWFSESPLAVMLSTSPDAGLRFLLPQLIDDSHPCGAPDLILLADGTVFAVWPERASNQEETSLWLRRISPGGSLSVPVLLGVSSSIKPRIRIGLINDFDSGPARFLVAYEEGSGDTAQIVVRLLTIDPATNQTRRNPCNCPDDDEAATGYAIRGRIVTLEPDRGTVTLAHEGIPEVLKAGVTEFKVDASFFQQARVGNEVFARADNRAKVWWLISPRLLVRPQK